MCIFDNICACVLSACPFATVDPRVHLCDWICQTAALHGECLYRDTCQQPIL